MSDNIDERVVSMKFDNADFEKKAAGTISVLDRLKESLNFDGVSKSSTTNLAATGEVIRKLADSSHTVDLSGIGRAVDDISRKFSALGAVGFSVIQNLTNGALQFAKTTAASILGPMEAGGKKRALDLEHADFMFKAIGVDSKVAMDSAKAAVEDTAYGLGSSAKAAAQLASSGIDVGQEMESTLLGIAGAAAMTGASFDEIAYVYSGSAAAGKVTNQDLLQFSTRGLNATAALATQMGISQEAVQEMATNGELSFKQFSQAMSAAYGPSAKKANETYAGSLENLKSAFSRIAAVFFTPHLVHMRDLFNAITPVVKKFKEAITPLIDTFSAMEGVETFGAISLLSKINFTALTAAIPGLISGFTAIFKSINAIAKIIGEAFKDVFPPQTEPLIVKISKVFAFLANVLQPTSEVLYAIRGVFRGLFSILAIGFAILKNIAMGFLLLFRAVKPGGIGILNIFGNIGDALFELKKSLLDGGGIDKFFMKIFGPIAQFLGELNISGKFEAVVKWFGELKDALVRLYNDNIGPKLQPIIEAFGKIKDALVQFKDSIGSLFNKDNLSGKFDILGDSTGRVQDRFESLSKVGEFLGKVFDWIGEKIGMVADWFKGFIPKVADALKSGDFNLVQDAINVGLFGAIIAAAYGVGAFLKNWLDNGIIGALLGGSFTTKIKNLIGSVTGTLGAMQREIKAEAMLKIAEAIAILTVSLVVLSLIDSDALFKALIAMGVGFGMLGATMKSLGKNTSTAEGGIKGLEQTASFATMSTTIMALAGAILILSVAVKLLSTMDPLELMRGLTSVSVLMIGLGASMKLMGSPKHMFSTSFAIIAIALATGKLFKSVEQFGKMDFKTLVQGMYAVGISIAMIVAALTIIPDDAQVKGIGIGLLAVSLLALSKVITDLGGSEMDVLAKGLGSLAIILALITFAIISFGSPKRMEEVAIGIAIISFSMLVLAEAVKKFGTMGLKELWEGIIGLGAALIALVVAVHFLNGKEAIEGAFTIGIIAASITILAAAIKLLADTGLWVVIGVMSAIVIFLGLLAVGALFLDGSGATEALALFGAALVTVGAGMALFGLGVLLFAGGVALLVSSIKTLAEIGPSTFMTLIGEITLFIGAIFRGIITGIESLLANIPRFTVLLGKAVKYIVQFLIEHVPEMVAAWNAILGGIIQFIYDNYERITNVGYFMLLAFLHGINDHIGDILLTVASIVMQFLAFLNFKLPDIMAAGTTLFVTFMTGLTAAVPKIVESIVLFLLVLMIQLDRNLPILVAMGSKLGTDFVDNLALHAGEWGESIGGFVLAIMDAIDAQSQRIDDGAIKLAANLMENLATAIDNGGEKLDKAIEHLVKSIVIGIIRGLWSGRQGIYDAGAELAGGVIESIANILDINSPSKVMIEMAKSIAEGFVVGFNNDTTAADGAAAFGDGIIGGLRDTLASNTISPDILWDSNPTITPVLDLTGVKRGAGEMNNLWETPTIDPTLSTQQATSLAVVAQEQAAAAAVDPSKLADKPTQPIQFTQINNAPHELSTSDIYRNTRSQIALAKEELNV